MISIAASIAAVAAGCHHVVPALERRVRHQERDCPSSAPPSTPRPSAWSATTRKSSGRLSLDRLAGGGDDLLAARKPIGLLRPERVAEGGGIERVGGVEMRVAPKHPRRDNCARHKASSPASCRAAPSRPGTMCRCRCRPARRLLGIAAASPNKRTGSASAAACSRRIVVIEHPHRLSVVKLSDRRGWRD